MHTLPRMCCLRLCALISVPLYLVLACLHIVLWPTVYYSLALYNTLVSLQLTVRVCVCVWVCVCKGGPRCIWVTLLGAIIPRLNQFTHRGVHFFLFGQADGNKHNDLTAAIGHWPANRGALSQSQSDLVMYSRQRRL